MNLKAYNDFSLAPLIAKHCFSALQSLSLILTTWKLDSITFHFMCQKAKALRTHSIRPDYVNSSLTLHKWC